MSSQLADALSNELSAAGGLTVVERQNTKAVLSEQEMAELGIVKKDARAAKSGQMTGQHAIGRPPCTWVPQHVQRFMVHAVEGIN